MHEKHEERSDYMRGCYWGDGGGGGEGWEWENHDTYSGFPGKRTSKVIFSVICLDINLYSSLSNIVKFKCILFFYDN